MQRKQCIKIIVGFIGILSLLSLYSCNLCSYSKSSTTPSSDTFTYDGFTYHTIKIGNQFWTIENAHVTHYRNGDFIRNLKTNTEWAGAKTATDSGAWCYYNNTNNSDSQKLYGKLYNWYAVNDTRGLAPQGWHVANNKDWDKLMDNLTKNQEGQELKSVNYWMNDTNSNKAGRDRYGFSALPAGCRFADGSYHYLGYYTYFWSSLERTTDHVYSQALYSDVTVFPTNYADRLEGISVRFVRD